jgi:hypothetical protein
MRSLRLARRIAAPVLRPLLLKLGWWPRRQEPVPRITAADRLRKEDVPTRVSIRDDQTLLVNGTPFFPIGLYYAHEEMADVTGEALRKLRAMGFNVIFFNGGLDSGPSLDRIREAGLHVWYRPPGEMYRDFDVLKEVVSRFGRHPAVLFWEMDDEPVLNDVDRAAARIGCRLVRRIDPYHPILCNQWFSNLGQTREMTAWARLADIYGFAVYPIPLSRWGARMALVKSGWPHAISVVGAQTDLWRSIAPRKPIIPILQAWAPDCIEDGSRAFPTYHEARFMAYQAVIHGAKGLHHYGAISTASPNFACGVPPRTHEDLERTHGEFEEARRRNGAFWDYYARVVAELGRMSAIFASRDAEWTPRHVRATPTANVIEWRIKQYGQTEVVLMVNASQAPATVEIVAPRLRGKQLNAWGEERTVTVGADGRFADTIESYGVRIYSDQPDISRTGDL